MSSLCMIHIYCRADYFHPKISIILVFIFHILSFMSDLESMISLRIDLFLSSYSYSVETVSSYEFVLISFIRLP